MTDIFEEIVYTSINEQVVEVVLIENPPPIIGGGSGGPIAIEDVIGLESTLSDLQSRIDAKFGIPTGTTEQYIRGDGSLATFPTIPTIPTLEELGGEPAIAAGTADQYRRGDKSWQSFGAAAIGSVLEGFSAATAAAITASDSILQALQKVMGWLNTHAKPTKTYLIAIETPSVQSYPIVAYVEAGQVIEGLDVRTASGTATVSLQINGVSVTGCSSIAASSVISNNTATGANTLNAGDYLTLNVSSVSSPSMLSATIRFRYS